MTQRGIAIIGAGGHAKVVIATLQDAGQAIAGVYDDDPARTGQTILGCLVLGPVTVLASHAGVSAVIAVGDNRTRKRIAESLPKVQWVTVVHPRAWVHASCRIGEGSVIFAGAIIQPDAVVGRHVIVNTGATIDHDGVIGDFAHVAPGAHLSGHTTVGVGAMLGTGSASRQGVTIGDWTTVGVGGVVVRDLPGGVIATGVPARPR